MVVRYLAGVTWYGHQRELREVAERLSPRSFSDLAREVEFDPARFAGLLKAQLQHIAPGGRQGRVGREIYDGITV